MGNGQWVMGNFQIFIYNVLGLKVQQSEIENSQFEITIDVSSLSSGVYFVQVSDETQTKVLKFVKE